ncbi:MAG: SsrA-binding protein SmpB [Methylococcales bacterium]|jgi:SsrA-binding protein|nr:SsrA-binding protein SmpB [Methylococcales bacterium]MBT7445088.1 SsrA-binding protein SmpB [Methylococcales bacterium]
MAKHKKSKSNATSNTIAVNKRARHDYFIETRFEAGIVLEGWEVKSLREGKGQLTESYVFLKNNEVFMSGCHITPLLSASTHIIPHPTRVRKLLLNRSEINKLHGAVERKGYTLISLSLYWKHGRVKLEIALAKGKQLHDKRETLKERDYQRTKQRNFKLG